MKILLGAHHFPPNFTGGGEYRAYRTAKELLKLGHEVQVVSVESISHSSKKNLIFEDECYEGVPIQRLFFDLDSAPNKRIWEYDNHWIGDHFLRLIKEESPDLLHIMSGYLITASPLRVAQLLGLPTVVSLTDFWFLCSRITMLRSNGEISTLPIRPQRCVRCLHEEKRRYRWPGRLLPTISNIYWGLHHREVNSIEQRLNTLIGALNRVDAIISPSKFLRSFYINAGVDPARIVFSRQGRDISNCKHRIQQSHTMNALRLAYIGQIAGHKGVHLLLEAIKRLPEARLDVKIFGDMSKDLDYSKKIQRAAISDPRVRIYGSFKPEEMAEVYEQFDILVVPSVWYENSPNVILEAYAYNTPVIASNLGGMSELIDHGVNGLLFDLGDPGDLADKINRVLDQPELINNFRNHLPEIKNIKSEIENLIEVYQAITNPSRSTRAGICIGDH